MRVVLFSAEWPEYMIGLANEMANDCDTVLVMPNNYGLTEAHVQCLQPKVRLRTFRLIDFKSVRENTRMIVGLVKLLWQEKPDILHIQSNGFRLFYWVAFFKPPKTKIVNTIHDPEKHSGDVLSMAVDDSLVVYLLRFFTKKYIVHGDNLIEELSRTYRVPTHKIVSIPHGHFEIYKQFQLSTSPAKHPHVLFFGRIWPYKGLDYFIAAANQVHKIFPEVRFCIAGRGENIDKYLEQIERPQCFDVHNYKIPNDEVGVLFERAFVVVLPYTDATQSGVIPIAYAYAKPVIATRVGGLPNVVTDGVTGFLVPPKSAEEIAKKIIFFLENQEAQYKMGEEAYKFAHTQLSWKKIAFQTREVYTGRI